jgi:addiction module HigA family antidote
MTVFVTTNYRLLTRTYLSDTPVPYTALQPVPFHRYLQYRGISQKKFAAQIGVQYTVLNEILNCKRPINVQFAMLVEAALGIDAELWMKMQTRYNMLMAKRDKTFAERLANIRKITAML